MFAKLKTAWDSDLVWSWRHSPVAIAATIMALLLFIGALGARWVAPYDPFDLTSIDLMDALKASLAKRTNGGEAETKEG